VRKAIRDYSKDFVAFLILLAVGLITLFVILSQQATALPSWFPILGEDRFALKAELQTAQAVTPGQGQTVNIAGVKVGDITTVELEDGVAVVSMEIDNEYSDLIHPDASILLRPRTGLQDMTVELNPGTETESVEEGSTIALASTKPNINLDQIISSLDGDTQAYLKLLLAGGAEALGGERSKEFAAVLRRLEPTTRDIAKINGQIAKRRTNLRRVNTNYIKVAERLARNDDQLAE
jgi:phospholipid/cholesterol/gamma-HCH transport system substrate-binding protein